MKHKMGRCGCGEITYAYTGEPINSVFCYCTQCQKHSGSDKWFGVWVKKENFMFLKGRTSTYSRIGDSGQPTEYHFCKNCGTTICAEVKVAKIFSIAAATLDDHDSLKPDMLIYKAYAPTWATFPKDVPAFDILPPSLLGKL